MYIIMARKAERFEELFYALIALALLLFVFHDIANAISNFAERHRGRAIKQLQTDD